MCMISARDYPFLQFVRDLAHYIAPYKKQFFAGAFLRLTSDIVALYPAWAVSQIVAILAAPSVQTMPINLLRILIILGIVSVYHGFFHSYSKILGYQVSEKAALDLVYLINKVATTKGIRLPKLLMNEYQVFLSILKKPKDS